MSVMAMIVTPNVDFFLAFFIFSSILQSKFRNFIELFIFHF